MIKEQNFVIRKTNVNEQNRDIDHHHLKEQKQQQSFDSISMVRFFLDVIVNK